MRNTRRICAGIFASLALSAGCVERTLTVRTDPPEALLTMNGLEVGRTPFKHDFVWYGTYDVEVRKEGYETLKTRGKVIAPWWQWVPFDLVAEIAPFRFKDHQLLTYSLRPTRPVQVDPHALLKRGEAMPPLLESSEHTRTPVTRPTTRATIRPDPHKPSTGK
ncbi:MAG TPA: PEGA domain-containing protein [Tepidisphaeraceae bacterium]|jgi:hypothetical protein